MTVPLTSGIRTVTLFYVTINLLIVDSGKCFGTYACRKNDHFVLLIFEAMENLNNGISLEKPVKFNLNDFHI